MSIEIFAATQTAGPNKGARTYHYSHASAVREAGWSAEIVPYVIDGVDDVDDVTISDDGTTFTVREAA